MIDHILILYNTLVLWRSHFYAFKHFYCHCYFGNSVVPVRPKSYGVFFHGIVLIFIVLKALSYASVCFKEYPIAMYLNCVSWFICAHTHRHFYSFFHFYFIFFAFLLIFLFFHCFSFPCVCSSKLKNEFLNIIITSFNSTLISEVGSKSVTVLVFFIHNNNYLNLLIVGYAYNTFHSSSKPEITYSKIPQEAPWRRVPENCDQRIGERFSTENTRIQIIC